MYYAAENRLSTSPIEGGVQISAEEYRAALSGVLEGKRVSVEGGQLVVAFPPAPEPGPEPEPPTIEEVRESMGMSFAQLLTGLVEEGWITEAEGEAWLEGKLPAAVNALIAQLPEELRFRAKARATLPSTVERNSDLVIALAQAEGKTPEEIDKFFEKYSQVYNTLSAPSAR